MLVISVLSAWEAETGNGQGKLASQTKLNLGVRGVSRFGERPCLSKE